MQIPERRLTILGMHYRPEATGNAPYTSRLAEAFTETGTKVTVLCTHPHYPEWKFHPGYGSWRRDEHIAGVNVLRLRHWVPDDPSPVARFLSELSFGLRLIFSRWRRPDAILLVSPAMFSSAVAMLRARLSRARRVVWVQDVYAAGVKEIGGAGGLITMIVRRIEARTLRTADVVVVIHDSFRRTVIEDLGVPAEKVHTIRNWSHIGVEKATDRSVARARLGWAEHDFIALHAGNQGLKQGLENLVDAARIVDERELPIRMVLLGDGNQQERLRELARGVRSLDFLPAVADDEFLDALRAADTLIVNEQVGVAEMSVPSKLTSYFAAGRPVVGVCAADGGASSELAASGAGVRVEPGQPAALVDQLEDMRLHPATYEALGPKGIRYCERLLGEDVALRAFSAALFG